MNITYTQNGDYLIPNIIIRKTKPLGHYGRLRKAYLEMHRPIRAAFFMAGYIPEKRRNICSFSLLPSPLCRPL